MGGNFLGIDWGKSKIGIAFADTETRMAFAVCAIGNDKTLLARLSELFSEREIGTVVIGIPARNAMRSQVDHASEQDYSNEAFDGDVSHSNAGGPSHVNRQDAVYGGEILGEAIRKEFPSIRIEFQDEMFTTKMASANLCEHGIRNIARFDDQEAARIILQEWLDSRNT
ncbi:MAG: pre-16S rRNA-processing nuclease YqgF [Candidatus Moranbacteria bacterium]|nr:pre-16S rRNA-processing nuclease YqgF [Candidatus Moranbacteria bacterium]